MEDQFSQMADKFSQTRSRELPAFLQPLLDRINATAKAETVFGPSRQESGRTIVPVARVQYGIGGGSGSSTKKTKKSDATPTQPDEGTGGGGGINVIPVGVYELRDGETRFIPVTKSKYVALGTLLGGVLVGILIGRTARS